MRQGKLRALAITSLRRSPSAPEIPTLADSGFAEVDTSAWFGVVLPASTSPVIVDRLQQEIRKAMTAEVRASFENLGTIVVDNSSPSDFAAVIATESAYWQKAAKAAGIKVE